MDCLLDQPVNTANEDAQLNEDVVAITILRIWLQRPKVANAPVRKIGLTKAVDMLKLKGRPTEPTEMPTVTHTATSFVTSTFSEKRNTELLRGQKRGNSCMR